MSSVWWLVLTLHLSAAPQVAVQPLLEQQRIDRSLRGFTSLVEFHETPLHLALHQLSEEVGVSIRLDEGDLAAEGIAADLPITVRLENISARGTLCVLLHHVGLSWILQDGQIVVFTEQRAQRQLTWQSHSLADLLLTEADYVDERCSEKLRWLIVATIAPKTWEQVGGLGQLAWAESNQTAFIYQVREVQDQVHELLEALRYVQSQEGAAMLGMTVDSALKIR